MKQYNEAAIYILQESLWYISEGGLE